MHGLGKILTNIMSVVLAVSLLAACGDTEPDLDFDPTYDDSPLLFSLSNGGSTIRLEWDTVEGATEYRLTQTAGDVDVLPGREWIGADLSLTVDTRTLIYMAAETEFLLESRNLNDLENTDWVPVASQNALGDVIVGAELRFAWEGPDEATEFRLSQTAGETEIISGELLLTGSETTIDVSELEFDVTTLAFLLEAKDAAGEWQQIAFGDGFEWVLALIESPLRFVVPFTGRTIQFGWLEVPGATEYRLTQTAGRYPILPANGKLYSSDQRIDRIQIPVHLFDWKGSRFALEAFVDGEWQFIGTQDTAGVSAFAIEVFSQVAPESAYASSLALTEDGQTMVVGAFGDSTLPADFECPADGSGTGAGDGSGNGAGDGSGNCDQGGALSFISGSVYSYDVASRQFSLLKSPNFGTGDRFGGSFSLTDPSSKEIIFGSAVAISDDGTTLAVSAAGEDSAVKGVFPELDALQDNEDATDSGAVYVFTRVGDGWQLQAYIKAENAQVPADGEFGDSFGWAVALSGDGNTLAVSALFEDSDGADPLNDSLTDSGAVFVYQRTDGIWAQQAYLKASNADAGDRFGRALALAEDAGYQYLAVSAFGEDGAAGNPGANNLSGSGAVYVFAGDAGVWTEVAYLKASNAGTNDRFGNSISFDARGELLIVGAPREDRLTSGWVSPNQGEESLDVGAAYLFERSGAGAASSWTQKSSYFKASTPNPNAQFGQAVVLSSSGEYAAVGAWRDPAVTTGINPTETSNNYRASGAVHVFRRISNDVWEQVAYVKAPASSDFLFFGAQLDMALDGALLGVTGNGLPPNGVPPLVPAAIYLY
ncbi:MAG: FG-GAP repeat protein [Gammaproteobacteria bacterium]|jgi:hypothetical protein